MSFEEAIQFSKEIGEMLEKLAEDGIKVEDLYCFSKLEKENKP